MSPELRLDVSGTSRTREETTTTGDAEQEQQHEQEGEDQDAENQHLYERIRQLMEQTRPGKLCGGKMGGEAPAQLLLSPLLPPMEGGGSPSTADVSINLESDCHSEPSAETPQRMWKCYYLCNSCGWSGSCRTWHKRRRPECVATPSCRKYRPGSAQHSLKALKQGFMPEDGATGSTRADANEHKKTGEAALSAGSSTSTVSEFGSVFL